MSCWDSVKKLNLKAFSRENKPNVCKKSETITLKTDVNLFFWLITVSRYDKSICKMLFIITLSAVSLALFYPNGDTRKTSKSKLLKEVKIAEYSKLSLLGYQYAPPTVIDFMAAIQPTASSIFDLLSNASDGIACKIIVSFQKSSLLVIAPNRYNVELSITSAERLNRTALNYQLRLQKDYTVQRWIINYVCRRITPAVQHVQFKKLKWLVPKSFQSYLSNASNKANKLTQKWLLILSFFQTQFS